MQAFFAHRGDLCRICKDLPLPRAAVFVQKHNGTRIREAQLFGGETLLCFAKCPHFFYIVNHSAGYPRFFCRPQRRIAFIRLPFGLRPVFCQKQRARKEPGPGSRFVRRDEVSRKQQKKMRFCVFTKPHLWCAGRGSPAPLRTVRPGRDAGRPGRRPDGRAVRLPSGTFRKRQKKMGSLQNTSEPKAKKTGRTTRAVMDPQKRKKTPDMAVSAHVRRHPLRRFIAALPVSLLYKAAHSFFCKHTAQSAPSVKPIPADRSLFK